MINSHKSLFRKTEKRDLEDLSVDGMLVLKWMIQRQQLMMIKKQRLLVTCKHPSNTSHTVSDTENLKQLRVSVFDVAIIGLIKIL